MNIQPNSKGLGLITLIAIFCITSPVFAQNGGTDEEIVQRYEELLEYRTNYTIEQDDDANQLSDTFTGIDLETNENVYIGDLTLAAIIPGDLPKVTLDEDPSEEETLAYGSYEHVEYQDMFDFESDGNGNSGGGFGVGVTGGKGDCPHGWNW